MPCFDCPICYTASRLFKFSTLRFDSSAFHTAPFDYPISHNVSPHKSSIPRTRCPQLRENKGGRNWKQATIEHGRFQEPQVKQMEYVDTFPSDVPCLNWLAHTIENTFLQQLACISRTLFSCFSGVLSTEILFCDEETEWDVSRNIQQACKA